MLSITVIWRDQVNVWIFYKVNEEEMHYRPKIEICEISRVIVFRIYIVGKRINNLNDNSYDDRNQK